MLIDKLKPEILDRLGQNHQQYKVCVDKIYNSLSITNHYHLLTVGLVNDIILFGDVDTKGWTDFNWRWGDKIFKQ